MHGLHSGFRNVRERIAKRLERQGETHKEAERRAGAILASRTRNASAKAKRNNTRLRRVK